MAEYSFGTSQHKRLILNCMAFIDQQIPAKPSVENFLDILIALKCTERMYHEYLEHAGIHLDGLELETQITAFYEANKHLIESGSNQAARPK